MSTSRFRALLICAGVSFSLPALMASALAASAEQQARECFAGHDVTGVEPYEIDRWPEGGVDSVLIGARVFVPAAPGLTAEWLNSLLAKRIAASSTSRECLLDVPGISISVQSGGPGFWISIATQREEAAREVLSRARTFSS